MRPIFVFLSCLGLACGTAFSADFDADLRARRDRDTDRLQRSLAGESTFYLVKNLNRKFNEEFRTIQLFHILDEKNPMLARRCFHHISDALLKGNKADTALFRKYAGDLISYLQQRIDQAAHAHSMRDDRQTKPRTRSLLRALECSKLVNLATDLAGLAKESGDLMTEDALRRTASNIHLILGWEKPESSLAPLFQQLAPSR